MAEMTGAQALIRQLQSEGVSTIFALPGVQIMPAFDAVHERQNAMRLVHTRHEQATTYMADGYAKATGNVGVAMVVPGPGALNATAGLGTAYASSSPVLLLSGQIPSTSLGRRRGELHEVEEQLDVFRPITKWNHRVTRVEQIAEAVHEAFRHLKTGRPRPVELELPPDTLMATGDVEILDPEDYPKPAGDSSDIETAARLLAAADRPAIIAGGGTNAAAASAQLIEVAELLQAPVMTTQQSKGVIPDDHPLHLGVSYIVSPIGELVSRSDAVLAVGTRLYFRELETDTLPTLVHIDVDASEIGKSFPTEVAIQADAKEALDRLIQHLRAMGPQRKSRVEEVAAWRESFRDKVRRMAPEQTAMVEMLRAELDDDAILVAGVTNIAYWSTIAYPARRPRGYLTSSYVATLGCAFPTALGAKIARPDKQVVALCGDGGFMYGAEELSTARRHGINVVAIVFNNNAYGASRWDQIHRFGERYIGTDLYNPDFLKLADAFGVIGMRTDPAGLGRTLAAALSANAPVLLEVEVPVMMPPFQLV
jgi:acetolactate synthase-1/2/3 large subunit